MKLNWGTGIVIAFSLFISFILYFVVKVQSNSKYDNELVVEEYYKNDAKYGDEMIRVQNAEDLVEKPEFIFESGEIKIVFPKQFNPKDIEGIVSLYRPSNKNLDFEIPISLSDATLLIPKKSLLGGRWDIKMEWKYDDKKYLSKKVIYLN